jgi:hypothetical protein
MAFLSRLSRGPTMRESEGNSTRLHLFFIVLVSVRTTSSILDASFDRLRATTRCPLEKTGSMTLFVWFYFFWFCLFLFRERVPMYLYTIWADYLFLVPPYWFFFALFFVFYLRNILLHRDYHRYKFNSVLSFNFSHIPPTASFFFYTKYTVIFFPMGSVSVLTPPRPCWPATLIPSDGFLALLTPGCCKAPAPHEPCAAFRYPCRLCSFLIFAAYAGAARPAPARVNPSEPRKRFARRTYIYIYI